VAVSASAGFTAPAPAGETLVELRDLTVRYRAPRRQQVHAVESVSLTIGAGECIGLVGESGCGKSTVARCLTGLQRPTGGVISFRGRDVWSMPTRERRSTVSRNVGLVFQDPTSSLNARMRVRDILTDPLAIHRVGDDASRRARAAELVELVGLSAEALERRPSQLSGGQRQRVAIARALALEPSVIVADEPTSALDVSIQNQILNLLLELRRELGLAVLFISHNIQAVSYLTERIAVMYLGRIVERGPVDVVTSSPIHPYTRALMSASPMITAPSRRIVLEGSVPSARNPPSGCPFRTRCWRVTDACAKEFPPLLQIDATHSAHCIHPLLEGADSPGGSRP
jgi:peptide/nickel transport system ATP-binding protein